MKAGYHINLVNIQVIIEIMNRAAVTLEYFVSAENLVKLIKISARSWRKAIAAPSGTDSRK